MEIYTILNKVNQLFHNNKNKNKNYITKISINQDQNHNQNQYTINQNITYINRDNKTEQYIINICDLNNILVTVPIKNTNYNYKTNVTIENLFNYLSVHTS